LLHTGSVNRLFESSSDLLVRHRLVSFFQDSLTIGIFRPARAVWRSPCIRKNLAEASVITTSKKSKTWKDSRRTKGCTPYLSPRSDPASWARGADINRRGFLSSCLIKRNQKCQDWGITKLVAPAHCWHVRTKCHSNHASPTVASDSSTAHQAHSSTSHLSQAYRLVTRLTSTLLFLSKHQLLEEASPMNAAYARQRCRSDVRVAVMGFLRLPLPPATL
jgi:hypothetical protein